jgi:ribonuclease HI
LFSDSTYVVNTMAKSWKRNANQDLWEELDKLAKVHDLRGCGCRGTRLLNRLSAIDSLKNKFWFLDSSLLAQLNLNFGMVNSYNGQI